MSDEKRPRGAAKGTLYAEFMNPYICPGCRCNRAAREVFGARGYCHDCAADGRRFLERHAAAQAAT